MEEMPTKLQKMMQDSKATSQTSKQHRQLIKMWSKHLSSATTCRQTPSPKCNRKWHSWWQRGCNHRPRHPYNINNRHTTLAEEIAMDNTDVEGGVAMGAAAVDKVQVEAEPVVVGLDTSNPERAGRAPNNKVDKQTQTHT